jgi:Mrp family chromosome partitioning ATPase/capsular polysaccharide biosynthesis protein
MELLAFLRTLRRRWILILTLTLVGAALGVASSQLESTSATKRTGHYYKATNTLVVDLSSRGGDTPQAFQGLSQVAIFTTTGAVPDAVAKKLGTGESGRELAQRITTTTNGSTNTIDITAVDPDPQRATELSDAFATALVQNLDQRGQDAYAQERDQLTGRLNDLQSQEDALLGQLGAVPRPVNYDNLKAQYDALVNQYRLTYDSYAQLGAQGPPTSRFTTLQTAQAVPIGADEYHSRLSLGATGANNLDANAAATSGVAVTTGSGSSTFQGPVSRGIFGALLGLLAGIGIAVLRERLDRRIRTRAEAEEAFGLPVLAEVPLLTRSQQKDRQIVTQVAPLSRAAEAYRAIRSSLLFSRAAIATESGVDPRGASSPAGSLFEPQSDDPFVIMVTSAAPGEGKTTTTANLAVVFSEAGSSVLVVNCDFRRPMLHRYFGVEDEPRRVHDTAVPLVKIVTNVLTDPGANPAQVLAAQRQVIAAARGRFDVILLDTAPLLTANDAIELVGSADLILLVARVGTTSTEGAQRTVEVLNRLDVPLGGVVLVGAQAASSDYYYYYQPGRVEGRDAGLSRRGRANGAAGTTNGDGNGARPVEMFGPETTAFPADPPAGPPD